MTRVVTTVAELKALSHETTRGAVLTMGALHQGHAQLMRRTRELIGADGLLVVTVFVNPTQFNDPNDLAKYPRTLEADVALCESVGVDVVFAPTVDEMYPAGVELPQFFAGAVGEILEGASRPGHFDAVATVVHRLLSITDADVTCFGEKDYQQLAAVRAMVEQSSLDVQVVGVATVRDSDGLALSSRNVRLTAEERSIATLIPQALFELARVAESTGDVEAAVAAGKAILAKSEFIELDYLVVTSVDLAPAPAAGPARALVAVKLGDVRLIDNVPVNIGTALVTGQASGESL